MDLSRRKFLAGVVASAAAPIVTPKIVDSLALDAGFTTQILTEVPWTSGAVNPTQIRELLLPGLYSFRSSYEIADQCASLFAEGPDTEV